jgi:hypothetical protein
MAVGSVTNDGGSGGAAGASGATDTSRQRRQRQETAAGRTASVVAAAPVGITTYDADGDRLRPRCPRGSATADVMMTMAGERGGEATARRRRGDYETTTRQQGCEGKQLWRRRWQGQHGNGQADNK